MIRNKKLVELLDSANKKFLEHCNITDCSECKYDYSKTKSCDTLFISDYIQEELETALKIVREKTIEEYRNKIVECCRVVGGCDFEDLASIEEEMLHGTND